MADIGSTEWWEAFHAHLDTCITCRIHPCSLCDTGHTLLTGQDRETNRQKCRETSAESALEDILRLATTREAPAALLSDIRARLQKWKIENDAG